MDVLEFDAPKSTNKISGQHQSLPYTQKSRGSLQSAAAQFVSVTIDFGDPQMKDLPRQFASLSSPCRKWSEFPELVVFGKPNIVRLDGYGFV